MSDNYPVTRTEALDICRSIAARQRNKKSMNALLRIISDVENIYEMFKSQKLYKIVPRCKCKLCGGLIYKHVSPFTMVTPGGNSIIGCPACDTMSWELCNPNIIIERE